MNVMMGYLIQLNVGESEVNSIRHEFVKARTVRRESAFSFKGKGTVYAKCSVDSKVRAVTAC